MAYTFIFSFVIIIIIINIFVYHFGSFVLNMHGVKHYIFTSM